MLNEILTGKASLESPKDDGSGPFRVAELVACRGCETGVPPAQLAGGLCPACTAKLPDPHAADREFARMAHLAAAQGTHDYNRRAQSMRDTRAIWIALRILIAIIALAIAASR